MPGFGIRDSGFAGRRGWCYAALVLSLLATAAACSSGSRNPDEVYVETLLAERARKDAAFRAQPDQPVPPARRDAFLPLKYFAPDPAYAAPASFTPAAVQTRLQMPTSTGKLRDMEQVGRLEFTLKGQALSLGAYIEAGSPPDRLFIPFRDLTSGTETYDAGRYLEIDRSRTGVYVVDFNRAFHPYCYYNPDYDCPYPPPSNRLPIPVRAGERMAAPAAASPDGR